MQIILINGRKMFSFRFGRYKNTEQKSPRHTYEVTLNVAFRGSIAVFNASESNQK